MNLIQIENKKAKVKLNDQVNKFSVDHVIEEIDKVYGMKAVEANQSFGEIIASADQAIDTMEIEIHSGGGSVFDGYRIFNAMTELRARGVYVTAKINTLAASMASVIAMAADKVTIASNGRIMIHDASTSAHGNAGELRKTAQMLDDISEQISSIYAAKTGKDKSEIRNMMLEETWINAENAVKMGFADEIFDTTAKTMKSILEKFKPDAALAEKVVGLEASLSDAENQITEINAQLAEAQADLKQAVEELSTAKAEIESISAEREEAKQLLADATNLNNQMIEEKNAILAELEELKASIPSKAAEILAAAGVPPVEVEANEGTPSIRDQYNKLTNPAERAAFRNKHWDSLIKQTL